MSKLSRVNYTWDTSLDTHNFYAEKTSLYTPKIRTANNISPPKSITKATPMLHFPDLLLAMTSSEVWGWSSYFEELARFLQSAANNYGSANSQYALYCINRLSICHRNVNYLKETIERSNNQDLSSTLRELNELLDCISAMYEQWNAYSQIIDTQIPQYQYQVPTQARQGMRGRPRFEINRDQLVYPQSLSFSWSEIA